MDGIEGTRMEDEDDGEEDEDGIDNEGTIFGDFLRKSAILFNSLLPFLTFPFGL